MVDGEVVQRIVDLVRRAYPGWQGFDDAAFERDEIEYKRQAVAKARELLAEEELARLAGEGRHEEVVRRVQKVGRSTNLLYLGTPSSGDLAAVYSEDLDKEHFSRALQDLLYGEGDPPTRLDRFCRFLDQEGLPNRWTLPTYLLFLLFPESELFVKPGVTRWFLRLAGLPDLYQAQPSGPLYRDIRGQAEKLLRELEDYGAHDMLDVQSALYVAHAAAREQEGRQLDRDKFKALVDAPPLDAPPLDRGSDPPAPPPMPAYSLEDCAAELRMDLDDLRRWKRAIQRKRQAIFYGPPGTGKTFAAEHLAKHLVGGGGGFRELVQFHPSYAYEDFIQGIRPQPQDGGGFTYELRDGRFLEVCRRARERDGTCVLIIDEINRANLSRVFGELLYLLEYRDGEVKLAAGSEPFSIPENLRILGTMNTADRSIALVDHALRRRFAFLHLGPSYETLRRYHEATGHDVEELIVLLGEVNEAIHDPHYQVGISFFLHEELPDHLEEIWRLEIVPYLEEYFFSQRDQVDRFRWETVAPRLTL